MANKSVLGCLGLIILVALITGVSASATYNNLVTLDQAAASQSTQAFLLVGTLILLPVILLYTGWSYWVFRGKVRADTGYH